MSGVKAVLAFVAFLVAVGLVEAAPLSWSQYKMQFKRSYKTEAEEQVRRGNFARAMVRAAKMQAANPLATFGANELSDRSEAELKALRGLRTDYKESLAALGRVVGVQPRIKESTRFDHAVDWRTKGAVTAVKNQAMCGDCWAFSTTGSIEGQWFLAGHELVSLSEQELTACDTIDEGCAGGLPWNAMHWLLNNTQGWITSEAAYPFASASGFSPACALSPSMPQSAQISGVDILPTGDESNMAIWVSSNGPLSIGVDATSWQTYTGGIMTNCVSQGLDHAVLIVGYDLMASTPYWIIKNSWATSWGEAGYIRVAYGSNQCLLADAPSSAVVKK